MFRQRTTLVRLGDLNSGLFLRRFCQGILINIQEDSLRAFCGWMYPLFAVIMGERVFNARGF